LHWHAAHWGEHNFGAKGIRDMTKPGDMDTDAAFDHEAKGAKAGLNPMFGDWQRRFDFAPVSYAAGGTKRAAFRDAIQGALDNKFFYSNEVRLDIVLHLDVQTVLETDETADVDNYAKAILDGLKGPQGILFDDTQVQALGIHWLDSYGRDKSYFTVSISGSPDDFMLKPVEFYEMPDGLWYPHGRLMWSDGGEDEQSDRNHYAGLLILEVMSDAQKRARHMMRGAGQDRLRAYQQGQYIASSARGFHRSRIDDGFAAHPRRAWRAAFEAWRAEKVGDFAELEALIDGVRDNYATLAGLLAGNLPDEAVAKPQSKQDDGNA
jgi:hypothetical protein